MQRLTKRFAGLLSASGIIMAIVVGIVLGAGLTFMVISILWGRPDLWPLRAG